MDGLRYRKDVLNKSVLGLVAPTKCPRCAVIYRMHAVRWDDDIERISCVVCGFAWLERWLGNGKFSVEGIRDEKV